MTAADTVTGAPPEVLMPYQQELLVATREHEVVVMEKSRRIGATWAIGADAVLRAGAQRSAGGSDVYYLGTTLDLAKEFVDTAAMWAQAFYSVTLDVEECLFTEEDPEKAIKSYRITFASGFKIMGLSSAPRSLRGRQGYVIVDEAAFHDDFGEVLKAALALLIWGGAVLVISTHNGTDSAFGELCAEIRAGKADYHLMRTTFDEAVEQGLYRRVCLRLGRAWSEEAEREWCAMIRRKYRDNAGEELDCIPRGGGGKYLARTLLEARAVKRPVLRWSLPDSFVDLPEDERVARCEEWLRDFLDPLLEELPDHLRSFFGEDFGRTGDLTTLWPLLIDTDLTRLTPFLIELRNVPFTTQAQVVAHLGDRLPRFSGAAFDKGVNGAYLAEFARQRWGPQMVAEVQITEHWYREHMPPMKALIEDGTIELVADSEVIDDFRSLEVIRGVPRVAERTKGKGGQRHGDAAIACALAVQAVRTLEAGPIRVAVAGTCISAGAYAGDPDLDIRPFY